MSCPSCGNRNFSNSKFNQVCDSCGTAYGTQFELPSKAHIEMMKARQEYLDGLKKS